eukprot:COSAG04_NODE_691_length_11104_cov_6.949841_13_plen_51_part_00
MMGAARETAVRPAAVELERPLRGQRCCAAPPVEVDGAMQRGPVDPTPTHG